MPITVAIATIGVTGLACSAILAVAARFFAVHEDPRVEEATAILPGLNCGGCGYAGCSEYARAIVTSGVPLNLCGPGGPEAAQALAHYMGVEIDMHERKVAFVLCGGDDAQAARKFSYNGVADCTAAAAVDGGDRLCGFACLGYGSCSRICPANAIEMLPGRLAVVHPEICISCSACVRACPRKIIKMIPASRTIHVRCSSKDKGPVVKQACRVGCIGCTICAKLVEHGEIKMEGALAVVDYAQPLQNDILVEKCPGHCIVNLPVLQEA